MPSGLEQALERFDGVATAALTEARAAFREAPGFFDELTALCLDPRPTIADGATWILKAEVEEGAIPPPEVVDRIARSLDQIASWQAQLHLCQMADRLEIDARQADRFVVWAGTLSDHPRPLLRAWALHFRVVLGLRAGIGRDVLEPALDAGDADKAASVRARARTLRKIALRGWSAASRPPS